MEFGTDFWVMLIIHVVLFYVMRKRINRRKKELSIENKQLRVENHQMEGKVSHFKKLLTK